MEEGKKRMSKKNIQIKATPQKMDFVFCSSNLEQTEATDTAYFNSCRFAALCC